MQVHDRIADMLSKILLKTCRNVFNEQQNRITHCINNDSGDAIKKAL